MKKLKLLYAEDERKIRKDFVIYLESMYEFTIYEADDGEEALELFKKHKPEIVLTDITMPKMDGLSLAKEIRKISKHTKIIILTAHSEQEKLMAAFDSNIVNYLLKPVQRKKLRESLDIAIETLSQPVVQEEDISLIHFTKNATFNTNTQEYIVDKYPVHLSKSESNLLVYFCQNRNSTLSADDIFLQIWDDFEKEFSATSVRTLVKKLRKKLPDGVLKNIYGGYYKIEIE
jgi:DNA-binding response OmpR family regulator